MTAGLTPHGGEQIRKMGAWMGQSNFSEVGCKVAVYADISSSRDNDACLSSCLWVLRDLFRA